jgi:DNA-binding PadR family transcriptional regulator
MRFFCNPRGDRGHHRFGHGEHSHHPCVRADFPFGGGGRRERIFASGDLKFVVLHLLAQKPGHGYDVIKALSELVGGDYSPSPGTVYPTLTMLEDLGWISANQDGSGRKEFQLTAEGKTQLDAHRAEVERILAHIGHIRSREHARQVPEVLRAMENLKLALRLKLGNERREQAVTRQIAEIIDRAAVEIERL